MHVMSMTRLREFWESGHRKAEAPLRDWYRKVRRAHWRSGKDVLATFNSAESVRIKGAAVMVFNVGGNDYRLVAHVLCEFGRVYVLKVMTHAEYSKGRWMR